MEKVKVSNFYATDAMLSDEIIEDSSTRNCMDTALEINQIPSTATNRMFYTKTNKQGQEILKPSIGHPCYIVKKNSIHEVLILIGTSSAPDPKLLHRYAVVHGGKHTKQNENDLETIPNCFYNVDFYLNLSCVMLVTGEFIEPNTNTDFAKSDSISPSGRVGISNNQYDHHTDVTLTPESEIRLMEAYHDYHSKRPKDYTTETISPYIHEYGKTTGMTNAVVNPQMEEIAEANCDIYHIVEIGTEPVTIGFPNCSV